MFFRYALRTTDLDAARRFYEDAIGLTLPSAGRSDDSRLEAWPLHERAIAKGAPPHWLGFLAVNDVDASANHLVQLGGQRLGPAVPTPDGASYATFRDPCGAVVALRTHEPGPPEGRIAWHQLHVKDADAAWSIYSELFGWATTETLDAPDLVGGHRVFAWRAGGEAVGSIADTARWPGVHTHWLFYLATDDIESAVARVRASGGTAMNPLALPDGKRLSACEDAQGAAFGLIQLA
ncbi:MAG TPA: VOC family protein [Polyangiaceae bacterium]